MPPWKGRYNPLLDALEALPPEQPTLLLPVAAIAALLGGPLPEQAWSNWFWRSSPTARTNWRRLGFTAQLDYGAAAVVFTRTGAAPRAAARSPDRAHPGSPRPLVDHRRVADDAPLG